MMVLAPVLMEVVARAGRPHVVKILVLNLEDELLEALETLCEEDRMEVSAAATEALRRYVAAEQARRALGSTELVSLYAEISNADVGYDHDDGHHPLA